MALLLAGLAMFGPFSIDTIFPAFPQLAQRLAVDEVAVQQTISVYLLFYALMSLAHGPLSDAWGRKRVILGGLVVFIGASVGCALSTDLTTLLVFRALQGLSAGVGMIVGRAVIRDLYHGHDAQRLMSQVSMLFGIAPAIAPIIGGWILLSGAGWPLIFWFLVVFSLVLLVCTARFMPETHPVAARVPLSPRGLLRVNVSSIAERFLSGELVARFVEAHPGITLDVTVSDDPIDLVAGGFDAGVRLGEVIEQDMVAVPLTGPQRQVAVAAPAYLERNGLPRHPRELVNHRCIGWRPAPEVAPYRWEFSEGGREFEVDVGAQVTTNDLRLMLRTALAGGGISFGLEENYRQWLRSGELVALLGDYLPEFDGFYLYYPNRNNQPPKLRALVEHVRRFRAEG